MISVADAFFRRIGLFCCLLCGICVQHTAVLGDVYNEGLGHDMMFRSGGLHHHIGSVGKLRGLNPAVLIREHFYYLILVSPKGCEPLPVPFCPFLVSCSLIKNCSFLPAEIVVIKGHNVVSTPGPVQGRHAPIPHPGKTADEINGKPGSLYGLQLRLPGIVRGFHKLDALFDYIISGVNGFGGASVICGELVVRLPGGLVPDLHLDHLVLVGEGHIIGSFIQHISFGRRNLPDVVLSQLQVPEPGPPRGILIGNGSARIGNVPGAIGIQHVAAAVALGRTSYGLGLDKLILLPKHSVPVYHPSLFILVENVFLSINPVDGSFQGSVSLGNATLGFRVVFHQLHRT